MIGVEKSSKLSFYGFDFLDIARVRSELDRSKLSALQIPWGYRSNVCATSFTSFIRRRLYCKPASEVGTCLDSVRVQKPVRLCFSSLWVLTSPRCTLSVA